MTIDDIRSTVRQRREQLELTQAELATRADVGRQWLTGFESGRVENPTWSHVMAVLDAVGLRVTITTGNSTATTRPGPAREGSPTGSAFGRD